MKISYTWLKELVATDLEPPALAEKLTAAGLAVETIEQHGDDVILELDLTSNRPDCLSHLGVAREVAALTGAALRLPDTSFEESGPAASELTSVQILDPDLCPRYSARLVRGVRVGPSPGWLAKRLEALGMRSINNVADVTNYVLLELGHPLHAFDLNTLAEQRIVVRRAREGERITTLEKAAGGADEYRDVALDPDVLVIADAQAPVAIGGVKGGKDTGISETTVDVLLECAYFTPSGIRRTSRALKLDTDASYRFERGADYGDTLLALDRAAALITQVAGGTVSPGAVDCYPSPIRRTPIPLRRRRFESLVGVPVEFDRIVDILHGLGFAVEPLADADELLAVAPSFRVDISIEEDLVEEVARVVGYETVPTTLPGFRGAGELLPGEQSRRRVRETLNGLGYDEAISLSFVERELDAELTARELGCGEAVEILNPVLEHKPRMRTSLLTGLVEALELNLNHGTRSVRLFEIGKRFAAGPDRPEERETLAILVSGAVDDHDYRTRRDADFFDIKGAVEAVLERLRAPGFTFERAGVEYLHRGQAAAVVVDGQMLGVLGRLSPELASRRKLKQPVYVAEIALDRLLEIEPLETTYTRLPRYPSVMRDISIVLPNHVSFAEVASAVRSLGVQNLAGVALYDVFTGGQISEGSRSLTLRVAFRSDERTLTDEEASAGHARIVEALSERFGAELR